MRDRAALCIAFGTFGLTAVAGAVFLFLAIRRQHCMWCPCQVEDDYLEAE